MPRRHAPLAICYDFDGTLSPGYMQNYGFIPGLKMTSVEFWTEVKKLTKNQQGDEILIYMGQMLRKADQAEISVKRKAFEDYGKRIELFKGVEGWFDRINEYGRKNEVKVEHYIISSGLREMISGTPIARHFKKIFASGFWYDHEGIARFPALGVNYTTKTQFLFRINKGSLDVWDKEKINSYVAPDARAIPFKNMMFFGDGETDIPCFRLVKDLGGHSVAVYKPRARRGGRNVAIKLIEEGRVNFAVPADFSRNSEADNVTKAIIEKIRSDWALKRLHRQD